jgi:DNA-directed RNA polymerase specialized sigma24 family protein
MLKSWRTSTSLASPVHQDLFLERYARLLDWALQLTSNDHAMAQDLVQNAYIQFTFTRP